VASYILWHATLPGRAAQSFELLVDCLADGPLCASPRRVVSTVGLSIISYMQQKGLCGSRTTMRTFNVIVSEISSWLFIL
jgi:hypothetical protein